MTDAARLAPRTWEAPLTTLEKGVPALAAPLPLAEVAGQGWRLLAEDLPLPVAVIRESDLRANSAWMRDFLAAHGASIAPHGKTTMAPALFDLQLADGAWAITVATPQQARVALAFGYRRIFMANQLIGRRAIADMVAALAAAPEVDFYCLVDDPAQVAALAGAARAGGLGRPFQVLVELGHDGGRTGCRSVAAAVALARQVAAEAPALRLAGVEAFEGLIPDDGTPATGARVEALLDSMVATARATEAEGWLTGEVLLTAGGTAYFDLVAERLGAAGLSQPTRVLLRSGCYITHDAGLYRRAQAAMRRRDPALAEGGGLRAALEVWAYVQSRPEPGRAIVALGKRDVSHDDMPVPLRWYRPGEAAPTDMPSGHRVLRLNDQHAHLEIPPDSPLRIGDMLGFGISHPCLTFDKWRVLHLVDDDYRVTGSLRTYF